MIQNDTEIPIPDNIDEFVACLPEPALKALARSIQARLDTLSKPKPKASHSFKRGDQVSFTYKGLKKFGCVIRINSKTISVAEHGDDGTWYIPPSRLAPLKLAQPLF